MKIAFFGTPDFTTDFLDTLHHAQLTPSLIVTNPDRPVGRGLTIHSPAPKLWGLNHSIDVFQPEKLDAAFFETLQADEWDLFIVIAYGKIIPEHFITLPTFGTINIHYSLLPQYRGATPVESAILHGDTITGIAIQQMRYKLDSGPIIAVQEVSIAHDDTTLSLRAKLNAIAQPLLVSTIHAIFEESITPIEQDDTAATVCKKIAKEDGHIDLQDDAVTNYRKYRAYKGWPNTFFYTEKHGKPLRVKITEAHFTDGLFVIDNVVPENGKPQTYEQFLSSLANQA